MEDYLDLHGNSARGRLLTIPQGTQRGSQKHCLDGLEISAQCFGDGRELNSFLPPVRVHGRLDVNDFSRKHHPKEVRVRVRVSVRSFRHVVKMDESDGHLVGYGTTGFLVDFAMESF